MPELLRWALAAFALYRSAQFIAFDDLMGGFRAWAGVYTFDSEGHCITRFADFVGCVYCVSLALAPLWAAVALWPTVGGDVLLAILGLAGAQAWLQDERRVRMRLEKDGR